jgi:hypothetical protein
MRLMCCTGGCVARVYTFQIRALSRPVDGMHGKEEGGVLEVLDHFRVSRIEEKAELFRKLFR